MTNERKEGRKGDRERHFLATKVEALQIHSVYCLFMREWLAFGGVFWGVPLIFPFVKMKPITPSKGKVPLGTLDPSKVNLKTGEGLIGKGRKEKRRKEKRRGANQGLECLVPG